jgi:hypothetical protein
MERSLAFARTLPAKAKKAAKRKRDVGLSGNHQK